MVEWMKLWVKLYQLTHTYSCKRYVSLQPAIHTKQCIWQVNCVNTIHWQIWHILISLCHDLIDHTDMTSILTQSTSVIREKAAPLHSWARDEKRSWNSFPILFQMKADFTANKKATHRSNETRNMIWLEREKRLDTSCTLVDADAMNSEKIIVIVFDVLFSSDSASTDTGQDYNYRHHW